MVAALALTAIATGLLLGCLHSSISVLLVTPLAWLVVFMMAQARHWMFWQSFTLAVAMMFVLQAAYMTGVILRFRKNPTSVMGRRDARAKHDLEARLGKSLSRP